jgi:hypothetical protein
MAAEEEWAGERKGHPASMDYGCPLWWVASFPLPGILWKIKWTIKWMVTAQEWRRNGMSGQQYWWPQSIFNWWPTGDGLVSYWWESNAEDMSNSFASGWISGCLKKQYWELFVAAMEDGYEWTLFQGRGKTMHRRRRNDRLTAHEYEEREKDFMTK